MNKSSMPAWKYCTIFLMGFGGDIIEVLDAVAKAFTDVEVARATVTEPYYPRTKIRPLRQ